MLTQSELIRDFNEKNREKFNEKLFERDEDSIIDELKKVILSVQRRTSTYEIKVLGFELIDNYEDIMNVMERYEDSIINRKNKRKKRLNQYSYINIKDTDFKILKVKYYIRDKEKDQYLDVIIQVPKIVNKYYFRIAGNLYSAIYQIVDGSTYNNATSTSKNHNVTLKTIFMYLKLFKYNSILPTLRDGEIPVVHYGLYVFSKLYNSFKFILAKYGLYDTLALSGLKYITLTTYDIHDENQYTIESNSIYINVPKIIYDNDFTTQSLIYTLYTTIHKTKNIKYESLFTKEFWVQSLGNDFNSSNSNKIEKGYSLLQSLESIYDIRTKEVLKLPEEKKKNVYTILLWLINEFSNLRIKDNLNILTKRIRYGEYLASLYAMKLSVGLYRLSTKNVTLALIKKAILIRPSCLLENIIKCNLVNYRNLVNDMDSITALKFTFKGISGIGEKTKKVPDIYKFIDPSQLGVIDVDSSSKSDPGMSGILCPMTEVHNHNYFSEFNEPNEWDDNFNLLLQEYEKISGHKEIVIARNKLLNINKHNDEEILENINSSLDCMKKLMYPVMRTIQTTRIEDASSYIIDDMGVIANEQL